MSYHLRVVRQEGGVETTSIGERYRPVFKSIDPEVFKSYCPNDDTDSVFCVISHEKGWHLCYRGDEHYIMTESGKTFDTFIDHGFENTKEYENGDRIRVTIEGDGMMGSSDATVVKDHGKRFGVEVVLDGDIDTRYMIPYAGIHGIIDQKRVPKS